MEGSAEEELFLIIKLDLNERRAKKMKKQKLKVISWLEIFRTSNLEVREKVRAETQSVRLQF